MKFFYLSIALFLALQACSNSKSVSNEKEYDYRQSDFEKSIGVTGIYVPKTMSESERYKIEQKLLTLKSLIQQKAIYFITYTRGVMNFPLDIYGQITINPDHSIEQIEATVKQLPERDSMIDKRRQAALKFSSTLYEDYKIQYLHDPSRFSLKEQIEALEKLQSIKQWNEISQRFIGQIEINVYKMSVNFDDAYKIPGRVVLVDSESAEQWTTMLLAQALKSDAKVKKFLSDRKEATSVHEAIKKHLGVDMVSFSYDTGLSAELKALKSLLSIKNPSRIKAAHFYRIHMGTEIKEIFARYLNTPHAYLEIPQTMDVGTIENSPLREGPSK